MNMLLLEPHELDTSNLARISDARVRRLLNTLGVTVGQILRVGIVNGPVGRGRVEWVQNDALVLLCEWEQPPPRRDIAIHLMLAMPRPKVMKRLWPQLSALGVRRIAIVNAENVMRCYFDSHVLSPKFIHPLLVEGLEQVQDTHLPEVRIEKRLKVFIEDHLSQWSPTGPRLLADPGAAATLSEVLPQGSDAVTLAVGPETGWTDYERTLFAQHGFSSFSLGRRSLRTDTACLALITLLRGRLMPDRPFDGFNLDA